MLVLLQPWEGMTYLNKRHTPRKMIFMTLLGLLLLPYPAFATTVVIDPGHGGSDPGAIGVNGLQEKAVNLDIALKVKNELMSKGISVIMTREEDRYLSLAQRVEFTNAQNADLFVSIHANWYSNPASSGAMVLYYDAQYPQESYPASREMTALSSYSKQLAQNILQPYLAVTNLPSYGLIPRSVYVVRNGTIPSALIETAFLSNSSDAAKLADNTVRTQMAKGIAEGIAAFKPLVFPDTVGHWSREAVLRMNAKGWLSGINNRYQPDRSITRAEFLSGLNRMYDFTKIANSIAQTKSSDQPANVKSPPTVTGSDLVSSHWAYSVMEQALAIGLIQGYEDGTVKPDRPVSRAEAAAMFEHIRELAGDAKVPDPVNDQKFTDVPLTIWYASAVYTLQRDGMISGMTPDTFGPDQPMKRGEFASLMDRIASVYNK
jgi:N-acetylmuramoyl-L-alanine amidase